MTVQSRRSDSSMAHSTHRARQGKARAQDGFDSTAFTSHRTAPCFRQSVWTMDGQMIVSISIGQYWSLVKPRVFSINSSHIFMHTPICTSHSQRLSVHRAAASQSPVPPRTVKQYVQLSPDKTYRYLRTLYTMQTDFFGGGTTLGHFPTKHEGFFGMKLSLFK